MPRLPWTRREATRSESRVQLAVEALEDRAVPAILTVGSGKMYATLGAAAAAAHDGDTVRIDAGIFSGSAAYAVWTANNLTIEGAGTSRTVLDGTGFSLPNRKALFTITGSNTTVRNLEFKGVHDSAGADKNWAGIRQEGANLTVQNSYFHDNDDGILGGGPATSNVIVEYSEFSHNGYGDGFSHNIYIGDISSFTLRYSYMHDAIAGHDVKSRAATNNILYNWIGATGLGSESYEINLPDGGTSYIIGNVIHQDASTGNSVIVDWGSENSGGANPSQGFYFVNNTVVNDRSSGASFVRLSGGVYPADVRLENNIFAGVGTVYSGPAALQSNNLNANPGFVNAAGRDYHLTSSATTAIDKGIDTGSANGTSLQPVSQYVAVANQQSRAVSGSAVDIGAFEFQSAGPVNQAPTVATGTAASPNPVTGNSAALSVLGTDDAGEVGLTYTWATTGTPPAAVSFSANGTNGAKNTTATFTKAGTYAFQVTISDSAGLTAVSNVSVTVNQTLTSIAVTPGSVSLSVGGTQQFAASATDQFGIAMSAAFTWSSSGGGSISATGLFTASTAGGPFTITASSGGKSRTAGVTVTAVNTAPTVATAAKATPSPVTGTSTALSILGADDGGEAGLTYTWATTGTPPAAVSFGANGSNGAKNTSATFTKAGAYVFQVTIRDSAGLTAVSNVNVTVNQTLTSIAVTPGSASLSLGGTQQFTASAKDQFGAALSAAFTWSTSGGGSISTTGLFTASTAGGPFTITAASGGKSGSAGVTVTAVTTTTPAFQQDSTVNGLVVMEAENFDAAISQGGKSWVATTTPAGYSGASAMTTPNTGVNNNTGYTTASPRLDYKVNFVKTGTYYIWIRGSGPTGSDDSVHAGLDGVGVASADRIQLTTGYGWTKSTMDGVVATINVTTSGIHTINLWMREDGAIVDKVLLTSNANYLPSAAGPAESPRTVPTGLTATYFDNKDLTGASLTRIDQAVNYDWGSGSPDPSIGADTFSARWTGKLAPRYSETYTFYTTSDDGVRLWVNGQLVIDQWNDHGPTTHSGTIALQAGQLYDIRLEFYENGGGAVMKLEWASASQAREVISGSRLYSR